MAERQVFNELNAVNVNDKKEQKNGLNYLSWTWAYAEVAKRFPDVTYEIIFDPVTNLPYSYDPQTGYMVYTKVTIEGVTRMMWLPVMDYKNRALNPATMTDINKSIMRCLAKNLAMFGLGLYIFNGEDIPEASDEAPDDKPAPKPKPKPAPKPAARPQEPDGLQPIGDSLPFTMTEPDPATPAFVCEHCGKKLVPYTGKDGKKVSLRAHAERSKQMFAGKIWCIDCINGYLGKES